VAAVEVGEEMEWVDAATAATERGMEADTEGAAA